MPINKVAGTIEVKGNGVAFAAKGSFSINLGKNKREAVIGSNGKVQGFSEIGQVPYIKGSVTDLPNVSFDRDISQMKNATITLKAANNKVYMWEDAYYCSDGEGDTEAGTWPLEFEAKRAGEV